MNKKIIRKKAFVSWLYYDLLKQLSDFEVQAQDLEKNFMSKRKNVFEIFFEGDDDWWQEKVNARTILKNEILLDLDPEKEESEEEFEKRCVDTIKILKHMFKTKKLFSNNALMIAGPSGSRGHHISIFIHKWLYHQTYKDYEHRMKYRFYLNEKLKGDLQKTSERVTINLEYSKHWKTSREKELTYIGLVGDKYKDSYENLKEVIKIK